MTIEERMAKIQEALTTRGFANRKLIRRLNLIWLKLYVMKGKQ